MGIAKDVRAESLTDESPSSLFQGEIKAQVNRSSVDKSLLDMLGTIKVTSEGRITNSSPSEVCERLAFDLRLALHLARNKDKVGLDLLAQTISQNALLVGAVNILALSIEMQGSARLENWHEIEIIIKDLEADLASVREQLGVLMPQQ